MKRIQLFEFEDYHWFPDWIRVCMTRLIVVMHNIMGTKDDLSQLITKTLKISGTTSIVDLCSGSGGPMVDVMKVLKKDHSMKDVRLSMTDLYPNLSAAKIINDNSDLAVEYETSPVDATNVKEKLKGLRTMICSFHHMNPENARKILKSASDDRQPICIFEISDNSFPVWIWWMPLPINMLITFFITPFVRPLTWKQIVFTYLIPIIPICFAWDGAASNARTYTLDDMDLLLEGLESDHYIWEKGVIKGKANKLYLIGQAK